MKTSAKLLEQFKKIDISGWELDATDDTDSHTLVEKIEELIDKHRKKTSEHLEKTILNAASEVLTLAVGYPASAWFAEYSPDEGQKNPMNIRVTLPLGEEYDEGPTWEFSLRDIIAILVGDTEDGDEEQINTEYDKFLFQISRGLRDLAQMIDDKIAS